MPPRVRQIGPYPEVGLAQAREARGAAKAVLRSGRDPMLEKKARRAAAHDAAGTFEAIARDWHARQAPTWTTRHAADVLGSVDVHREAMMAAARLMVAA